ncbi:hypothetical protein [Paraflavitalea speifideaquila]|uniref:hypothetical protein n=1 Tax=Paraflavitalea speifideaquila TaxID=3076558 RepID=UPI0028F026AC|nr:hypothetical protein [Paraflavitalea speifideiaquila]
MTLNSTNPVTPAIKVDLGSTLEDSCSQAGTEFVTRFANNTQGLIDGTWSFLGCPATTSPVAASGTSYARFPVATTYTNLVKVNGTIKLSDFGYFDCKVPAYLSFESGAQYWIARDGGIVPAATWNTNSTLSLTGIKTGGLLLPSLPARPIWAILSLIAPPFPWPVLPYHCPTIYSSRATCRCSIPITTTWD